MCGIAGFISEQNIDNRKGIIKAMTDCIIHRGPDAEGMWLDEQSGVTLGHRRLSIIDLSANGSQPMMSSSERYVISYNGEIYNSSELKKHLESRGHNIEYRGTSDTEVLLESFDKLGIENTLNFVKGMLPLLFMIDRIRNYTLQETVLVRNHYIMALLVVLLYLHQKYSASRVSLDFRVILIRMQ